MRNLSMQREWAMPDKNTFQIKPIRKLLDSYVKEGKEWADPFAGSHSPATMTNDLDPEAPTVFHMEALEFLQKMRRSSMDGVLFDPPYSPRQVSESYKRFGLTVNIATTQSSYWRKLKDEVHRVVKKGGIVISFGWNTNGMGKTRGYEMLEVLLVAHGGAHNDTICVVEKKV